MTELEFLGAFFIIALIWVIMIKAIIYFMGGRK